MQASPSRVVRLRAVFILGWGEGMLMGISGSIGKGARSSSPALCSDTVPAPREGKVRIQMTIASSFLLLVYRMSLL